MTSKIRHWILAVFTIVGVVAVVIIDSPRTEGNILLAAMAPVSWLFVLSYLRTPWRATREGRSVMYFVMAFAALLTQVMFSAWYGEYWMRDTIRPLTYVGIFVALLNFELTRREGRAEFNRRQRELQREIHLAEQTGRSLKEAGEDTSTED